MALELDFNLSISECCDELQFCDTTCKIDPNNPAHCCDGYGALGNPILSDITSTSFDWILPSGAIYNGVNPLFLNGLPAQYTLTISGGTSGSIAVAINSLVLGVATYSVSIAQTIQDLVNDINSNTTGSGWFAFVGVATDTIIIQKNISGVAYNNMLVDVSVSGTLTTTWVLGNTTALGREGSNCFNVKLDDLVPDPCTISSFPSWLDGVYTLTYVVYGVNGELTRKTKKFFIDCNAKSCLKSLIKATINDCKDCEEADPRIVMLRSKLDAARNQFDECLFDCAQETIDSVNKQCRNFCLDCD